MVVFSKHNSRKEVTRIPLQNGVFLFANRIGANEEFTYENSGLTKYSEDIYVMSEASIICDCEYILPPEEHETIKFVAAHSSISLYNSTDHEIRGNILAEHKKDVVTALVDCLKITAQIGAFRRFDPRFEEQYYRFKNFDCEWYFSQIETSGEQNNINVREWHEDKTTSEKAGKESSFQSHLSEAISMLAEAVPKYDNLESEIEHAAIDEDWDKNLVDVSQLVNKIVESVIIGQRIQELRSKFVHLARLYINFFEDVVNAKLKAAGTVYTKGYDYGDSYLSGTINTNREAARFIAEGAIFARYYFEQGRFQLSLLYVQRMSELHKKYLETSDPL